MKIPIGTIHHVDESGGFVLIRSSRTVGIEPGTQIAVFGDQGEMTASLEVSPARKGQFLTADILSGMPQSGQRAMVDYVPAKRADSSAATPAGAAPGNEVQILE